MSREAHVRFSEGVGVGFPRATRLSACQSASKIGSDALLVKFISLRAYQPSLKQIDFPASVH